MNNEEGEMVSSFIKSRVEGQRKTQDKKLTREKGNQQGRNETHTKTIK